MSNDEVLERIRAETLADIEEDWTVKDGRSNSSNEFRRLVDMVERLIRSDAHQLIAGRADRTAGLVVAQLAHAAGLAPLSFGERRGYQRAIAALRDADGFWSFAMRHHADADDRSALVEVVVPDYLESIYPEVNEQ